MDEGDLLQNLQPTKNCPVKWDEMSGTEVIRTCKRCGRLVLNEQTVGSPEFAEKIELFKNPKQKSLFLRTDGRLMIRRCGMEADYGSTWNFIGWTGILAIAFSVIASMPGMSFIYLPAPVYLLLYLWNLLGVVPLAHTKLHPRATKFIIAVFIAPIVIVEVVSIRILIYLIYWAIILHR